ncbi:Uncharacterised protein [Klebsiella pneumoniae]|nr:Uncharacterised protein [Klebsiella pneumoniae]
MVFNRPYKFNVFCSVFQVVDRISMKNRAFNYALSTIKYMYIFYYIVEVRIDHNPNVTPRDATINDWQNLVLFLIFSEGFLC